MCKLVDIWCKLTGLLKLIHIHPLKGFLVQLSFTRQSLCLSCTYQPFIQRGGWGWAGRFLKAQGNFKCIYIDELIWVCLETNRRKFLNISNLVLLIFASKTS